MSTRFRFLLLGFLLSMGMASAQNRYRMLPPAAMQHDLAVLHAAFTTLHPGIYRYNRPEEVERRFATLQARCRQPLDERQFYLRLSQLAESVHCGHTFLNPLNLPDSLAERFLPRHVVPLLFQVTGGSRLIVTHTLTKDSRILPGDAIQAINGVPVRQIIDSLLTVSRSDGRNALGKKLYNISETADELDNYSLFDIYFAFFFGAEKDFLVTIAPLKGKTYTVRLAGQTLAERAAVYKSRFGALPADAASWSYRQLDGKTAYFRCGTFAFWNSSFKAKRYVDSVFQDLAAKPAIRSLVIDIRDNEGGDGSLGPYILSYLAEKPIGCDEPERLCCSFLAVTDTLKPYLSTWDPSFAAPKDSSRYFRNEAGLWELRAMSPCTPDLPRSPRFSGKVALLIGPKNSSATFEMALLYQQAKLGILVGEPTGGTQQGLNGGKMFFLRLPGSHFEVDLPIQHYHHPGKPDEGVRPDFEVRASQTDIARKRDPQLEAALQHIRN